MYPFAINGRAALAHSRPVFHRACPFTFRRSLIRIRHDLQLQPSLQSIGRKRHADRVNEVATAFDHRRRNVAINWGLVGACVSVYVAWNFTIEGITYTIYERLRRGPADDSLVSWPPAIPSLPEVDLPALRAFMKKNFVIMTSDDERLRWNIFGVSVSHINFLHLAANVATFISMSKFICMTLTTRHFITLLVGSAVTSSVVGYYGQNYVGSGDLERLFKILDWTTLPIESEREATREIKRQLQDWQQQPQEKTVPEWYKLIFREGQNNSSGSDATASARSRPMLGFSGVVAGTLAFIALVAPTWKVCPFFLPVPVQISSFMLTTAVIEGSLTLMRFPSPFGHSAHLGGEMWGVVCYAVFGRHLGGVAAKGSPLMKEISRLGAKFSGRSSLKKVD